jgi:hypothetical protein
MDDNELLADLDLLDDADVIDELLEELEIDRALNDAMPTPPTITPMAQEPAAPEVERDAAAPDPSIIPPGDPRLSDSRWMMTHQSELVAHAQARISRGDFQ